LIKHNVIIDQR